MAKQSEGTAVRFRKCTLADLDAIMELQEVICQSIGESDIFVPSEKEDNVEYLSGNNFILGAFDEKKLIAYCSFSIPGDKPHNLAWDLDWPQDKVCHCAKVDTIVVHPQYRGLGLQQRLLRDAIALAADIPGITVLLTTVSPKNKYSLRNVQAAGFKILIKKLKYGGRERFILGRELFVQENK